MPAEESERNVEVRSLIRGEVDLAVDWAASEGWNPGLEDAGTFDAADPGAFLGAFVQGELASVIAAARHGAAQGFIGFYICRPNLRGRGLGLRIWHAGMDRLRHATTIGFDGVIGQQASYRGSGFMLMRRNVRYAGLPGHVAAARVPGLEITGKVPCGLMTYDAAVNGHPRQAYFSAWMGQPGAVLRAARDDGRIVGYGLARPCRQGHKIGPLCADTPEIAASLWRALVRDLPGLVDVDVPQPNDAAVALARAAGLAPVFETARMYRSPAPPADLARTFGVMSFEFG